MRTVFNAELLLVAALAGGCGGENPATAGGGPEDSGARDVATTGDAAPNDATAKIDGDSADAGTLSEAATDASFTDADASDAGSSSVTTVAVGTFHTCAI